MKTAFTLVLGLMTVAAFAQEPQKTDTTKTDETQTIIIDNDGVRVESSSPRKGPSDDTTRISIGNTKIIIVEGCATKKDTVINAKRTSRRNTYELTWWNGIDLGVNGILNSDYDTDLGSDLSYLEPNYAKSRYIAFNFAQVKGRLIGDYVGISTGMSVQFYNYKFGGDQELLFAGDSLFHAPTGDKNVTKNKLRTTYLAVPVMLEFNTSTDQSRSFHISAGVVGKLRMGNMYKQKYDLAGDHNKYSLKGDLGLNRWAADAMVRVGYGWFTLYGQVALTPLFDNDNTPDLYTASVGIFMKI